MIRKIIPLVAIFCSAYGYAQLGVGTRLPKSSALLEVQSNEHGILIPRVNLVSLTEAGPIKGELVESLLVYNLGGALEPGFYYWYKTGWIKLQNGESAKDTTNKSFTLMEDFLTITDSNGDSVKLAVAEIASNSTFVTNLAGNSEFVTHLGDNLDFVTNVTNNQEFISNIINKLSGLYGNVGFDEILKNFYYYNADGKKTTIDWSNLDTTNTTFTLEGDFLSVTDSKGNSVKLAVEQIASNSTFVTNLAGNKEFITKLGGNIDFVTNVTNNQEFIDNIINKLEGTYGNVGYDSVKKELYYFDKDGNKVTVEWSDLDTTNSSFTLEGDFLTITDSKGSSVKLAVEQIASNSTFVTNLAGNKEFITKLGDNIDFITNVTNNQEFIDNIINKLEGTYGNVGYDSVKKELYYFDKDGNKVTVEWSDLDTTNSSFTLEGDFLTITDSKGNSVTLAVEQIASNSTFVTNLAGNKEFITKLGDNIDFVTNVTNNQEFIDNIINKLEGTYGNVGYDSVKKELYYFDKDGNKVTVEWSDLDTTNSSFTLEGDFLTITDSKGNSVTLAVEQIASNSTFVTNLAGNKEFITKLGDNIDFVTNVTNNQEFIDNIINKLEGTYGNVGYDSVKKELYYFDKDGNKVTVEWSDLDTTNSSFTLEGDFLTITDSKGNSVTLAVEQIASNSTFVTNLAGNKEFITKLGDNIDFVTNVTNNQEFIDNIINKLEGTYGNV
ncbi:hypothetical protein ACYSNM_13635, partial [Myroides sp. LJL116]